MSEDVIIISDSENDEKILKLKVEGDSRLYEVPLESNGNLSVSNLHMILPKAAALIIQCHSLVRLIKPKNGYFYEPKEKWENVLVSVILKEQTKDERSTLPSISDETSLSGLSGTLRTSTPINGSSSETRDTNLNALLSSTTVLKNANEQDLSLPQQITSKIIDHQNANNEVFPLAMAISETAISKEDGEILSAQSSVASVHSIGLNHGISDEPSIIDILDIFNVDSIRILKETLCRGNKLYYECFDFVAEYLKKTLFAYPTLYCNNEIVRLLYYCINSNLLYKKVNSKADEDCELCGRRLTVSHILSLNHIKSHKSAYNKEPPEILTLLEPKNYSFCIDSGSLYNLKIQDFKRMEKLPQFTKMNYATNKRSFFTLKYKLIHRILEANLEITNKETFGIDKIFFLRDHAEDSILSKIFVDLPSPYNCFVCEKYCKIFSNCLRHILTTEHLNMGLNQKQFDMISVACSFIKESPNGGYMFLPMNYIKTICSGKRKHETSSSTSSSDINVKRQKLN